MLEDAFLLQPVCHTVREISIRTLRLMRIQVRIGPPHPLAIKWGGSSDETGKTEAPCHSRCGTIKIPLCSKARKVTLGLKFVALHRLHKSEKKFERDIKP
jgi:hypothetical protein